MSYDLDALARRRSEAFADLLTPTGEVWEHCAIRTDDSERRPTLFYFRPGGHVEIEILKNTEKGGQSEGDAFRRVIGMLGEAGWQMGSDASMETRWLEHGRGDLFFKRRTIKADSPSSG